MPDAETPLAGKRCLVLDDEFLIVLDVQQILERAGAASVVCTGNSAEALAALRNSPKFDIAVVDINLNDAMRQSQDVVAALREGGTPFVFLTGMHAEDLPHSAQFPDAPVVEKPYEAARLLETLRRALAAG